MAKVERAALAFAVALVVCASCDSSAGGSGGETHWLDDCNADADCGGNLTCRCGVCTRECRGDADCRSGSRTATCFDSASPGIVWRCGGDVAGAAPGICLNVCGGSAECPAGEDCVGGRCVTEAREGGATGAPTAGEGGSAPPPAGPVETPNDIAGKYARTDSGIDFETPVAPAEPRLGITGPPDVSRLVGTWIEVEADGSPCRTERIPFFGASAVCARLSLVEEAGRVSGVISWDAPGIPLIDDPVVGGPFAPAADATRAYPEGAPPASYAPLSMGTFGTAYRVLDGAFADGHLSFWYSPLDLWREWCALQTPLRYDQQGKTGYRCVREGADESNTDLGVLALCTTQWDFGGCEGTPCVCAATHGTPYDGGFHPSPLCKPTAMCNCTAEACMPALRTRTAELALDVDLNAGQMTGTRTMHGAPTPIVLRKVTP